MKKVVAILLTLVLLSGLAAVTAYADTDTSVKLVGDVDGDRDISILDATWLQRHLIDAPLPFTFDELTADADEDGNVSVIDVTSIQRWLINAGRRLNLGEEVIPRVDKNNSYPTDYYISGTFVIYRICQTHFYAIDLNNDDFMRINGELPEQFCVKDVLGYTVENFYRDNTIPQLVECDLKFLYPNDPDPNVAYKPVIYLYPEEETEVDVKLDIDGSFIYTDPAYNDGWKVTASPDGTLTGADGKTYPYLFWEARMNTEYSFSKGFCVKGSDTEAFLQETLTTLGLNENEKSEFIDFWLRYMQKNPYNVISFQTTAYTDAAKLSISPQPDTTIRVFMAYYASDKAVDIPAQTFTTPERQGFTAVEWGGRFCG